MNVYTVTEEFALPGLCLRIYVGDVLGKLEDSIGVVINDTTYVAKSLWNWVGSVDGLNYMTFSGTISDPISGGSVILGGTVAINNGESVVTLSGLELGFVPSGVLVTTSKPTGGDNLFATVREDSVTEDGFIVDLSAPADGDAYELSYLVVQ